MKQNTFDTLVQRVADKRASPAFPLIRLQLEKMGLPVKDLDDLYVWENLEFSLLCLEELQFKPILEDALSKAKEKQDKILAKRSVQTTTNNKFNEDFTEEIKNEIKQDKFISEDLEATTSESSDEAGR